MVVEVEAVFRAEYGRAVAVLVRFLGDIDLAEEAVQDAFTTAVRRWPETGVPPSPAGWITTTARNRAVDRLRRESSRPARHAEAALLHAAGAPSEEGPVRDDRLRPIFTCCHPALALRTRVALTLRLLGGLATGADRPCLPGAGTDDGAAAGPGEGEDPRRRHSPPDAPRRRPARPARGVLAVVYLIFNQGYEVGSPELRAEAPWLGRLLAELMPDEPEVIGLLTLMLLVESRRAARESEPGRHWCRCPSRTGPAGTAT